MSAVAEPPVTPKPLPSEGGSVHFQAGALDDYNSRMHALEAQAALDAQLAAGAPPVDPAHGESSAPSDQKLIQPAPIGDAPPAATPPEPAAPATPPAPPAPAADAADLANNWRVSADGDPVKKVAFSLLKENPALGLGEAEALARQALGKTSTPPPAVNPAGGDGQGAGTVAPVTDTPAAEAGEVAALEAKLLELQGQMRTAIENFAGEDQARLDAERAQVMLDLAQAKTRAEFAARDQAAEAEATHKAALAQSRAAVAAKFGDHYKAGTPFAAAMDAVYSDLEKAGDPRLNGTDAPELVAQIAAIRLGINPTTPVPTAPQPTAVTAPATEGQPLSAPQAGPRAPQAVPPIAPGSARSSDSGATAYTRSANLEGYNEKMGISDF